MRILQVVTMFSPDGAYGGPSTVAVNQCEALRHSGNDVELLASYRGYESPPSDIRGTRAHLFPAYSPIPALGFAGMLAPRMWTWARRHLRTFDIVHVHLARDLVTLPIARAAQRMGVPVVIQTHGMIDESTHPLSGPLDALLTRRTLRRAQTLFYLTDDESRQLTKVAGSGLPLEPLPNGIATCERANTYDTASREVLFLARLQERKRPLAFVEAAVALRDRLPDATFTLVGPDEGEAIRVQNYLQQSGDATLIRWEGPVPPERSADRMRGAAVYVLPSINEPFPMTVLEAMANGLPVIVTNTCGLADSIRKYETGIVVNHEVNSLSEAILRLMDDTALRARLSQNAIRATRTHFDINSIAERLMMSYQRACSRSPSP